MNSSDRSTHLDDLVADFVLGRMPAREHALWLAHVAGCAACRTLVETAERLRLDEAHLSTDRIVGIADGAETSTPDEARHLAECAGCAGELELLRGIELPNELRESVPSASAAPARRALSPRTRLRPTRRIALPMGLVAMAAIVLLMVLPRGGDPLLLAQFARLEPLPVRITRSVAEPGSLEEARLLGLEAYRAEDWTTAATHLEAALARGGGADLRLYLGSARLLAGEDAAAVEAIDAVLLDDTVSPGLLDEARWLRVQLALRADDAAEVTRLLAAIEASGGRRAAEAQALREKVASARN